MSANPGDASQQNANQEGTRHAPDRRGLRGKIAVITGAASGIGKATAERLAEEGCILVLADVQRDALESVAASLRQAGAEVTTALCDVADETQVAAMARSALDAYGRIDILANIAGISPAKKDPIDSMDSDLFRTVLNVNLLGSFYCIKHVAGAMKQQRSGRIVNIASIAALQPTSAFNAAYGSSKAGVASMTRHLVMELSEYGITVNSIAPGITVTPMTTRPGGASIQNKASMIPLQRLGHADDIAASVAFLASNDASYITGQLLVVDGGLTSVTVRPQS